jgi:APA family basic amino acid/polyamine antiporter
MIRLRRKQPGLNRPYRAFGYPVTAYVFLVAAIALTVNLWLVRPVRSTLGLLVIAAGIPLFYRWRKNSIASLH